MKKLSLFCIFLFFLCVSTVNVYALSYNVLSADYHVYGWIKGKAYYDLYNNIFDQIDDQYDIYSASPISGGVAWDVLPGFSNASSAVGTFYVNASAQATWHQDLVGPYEGGFYHEGSQAHADASWVFEVESSPFSLDIDWDTGPWINQGWAFTDVWLTDETLGTGLLYYKAWDSTSPATFDFNLDTSHTYRLTMNAFAGAWDDGWGINTSINTRPPASIPDPASVLLLGSACLIGLAGTKKKLKQ